MTKSYIEYISDAFVQYWDSPAFSDYPGNTYLYREVAKQITQIHTLFENLQINKGDKIAICGRNSSNWAMTFLAITSYGCVAVPLLHDFASDNIHYILQHSDSQILFVSEKIWRGLDAQQLRNLKCVVLLDDFSIKSHLESDIVAMSDDRWDGTAISLIRRFHHFASDDLLVLNYTSGTTSNPKGVMIPERAVASNITFGYEVMPILTHEDHMISMLPLAHTYGMSFEFLTEFSKGVHLFFLTKPLYQQYLLNAFAEIRPKVLVVVPLILEKIVRKGVFPFIKNRYVRIVRSLPVVKSLINAAIRRKLCNVFGGKFYEVIVGGASLSPDVEEFLKEIKFPYTVGYGMTECSPIIGYRDWKHFKKGSCGGIVPRMEIKMVSGDSTSSQGEFWVRGENVMLGYYKNDQETNNAFSDDGWMKTGDVGVIDSDGDIFIKGRCKTMMLGSNGQNIYPEEIESLISAVPFVSETLVVQRDGKLYALVYPDYQNAVIEDVVGRDELAEFLEKQRKIINKQLPSYEQVAAFEIMNCEFEKTPKKSIKRYLYS